MTGVEVAFAGSTAAAFLAALAGGLMPRSARVKSVGVLTAGSAVCALAGAVTVMCGAPAFDVSIPWLLPFVGVHVGLDALGALFVVVAALVSLPAAIYGIDYCRLHHGGRAIQAVFPIFVWSLLFVPLASGAATFLFIWEVMALSSLVLVVADHRLSKRGVEAGRWYAVMTQMGFIAILIGFSVLVAGAGGDSFSEIRAGAPGLSRASRTVIFVLVLVGFGSKAGVVPLHVWLPRAHPEAPSHVSALMSGVMVKLGIYGILRVCWDLMGGGPAWWGVVILALGAVSAVFGILHALVSSDMKRLLAYSTTENVGLILIGVGAAGLLSATGRGALASLAMAGAMLFVLNHAAFKGLLFLCAGAVGTATGLRDLDRLGGLMSRMPVTGLFFAVGALAIAAMPPLNGFVSEWLLLQALVNGLPSRAEVIAIVMPVAVAVVALTGGLAAVTFVKALGTGFLALPRSEAAGNAREVPKLMQLGMLLLALMCVLGGLVSGFMARPLARALEIFPSFGGSPFSTSNALTMQLSGTRAVISPLLIGIVLMGGVVLLAVILRSVSSGAPAMRVPAWGCGRTVQTARMEYTATSFAEPLQRVFDDVLRPDLDIDVSHEGESRYYVEIVRYRQGVSDAFEKWVYLPLALFVKRWGDAARRVQNGSIQLYLGYATIALITILVVAR